MKFLPNTHFASMATRPEWLDGELAYWRGTLPELKLDVMMGDELPGSRIIHQRRMQRLESRPSEVADDLFKLTEARTALLLAAIRKQGIGTESLEKDIAESMKLGNLAGHAFMNVDYATYTDVGGRIAEQLTYLKFHNPPTAALVLMEPGFLKSDTQIAARLGLPEWMADHEDPMSLGPFELAHEMGHLARALYSKEVFTTWQDELGSDLIATARMEETGTPQLSARYKQLRTLDNLLAPLHMSSTKYWNVLAQAGKDPWKDGDSCMEITATVELKHRAASWLGYVNELAPVSAEQDRYMDDTILNINPTILSHVYRFTADMNNDGVRHRATLLQAVTAVVEADTFTHPGTRQLAQMTCQGAHALLPGLMEDKKFRQNLRAKPLPL